MTSAPYYQDEWNGFAYVKAQHVAHAILDKHRGIVRELPTPHDTWMNAEEIEKKRYTALGDYVQDAIGTTVITSVARMTACAIYECLQWELFKSTARAQGLQHTQFLEDRVKAECRQRWATQRPPNQLKATCYMAVFYVSGSFELDILEVESLESSSILVLQKDKRIQQGALNLDAELAWLNGLGLM